VPRPGGRRPSGQRLGPAASRRPRDERDDPVATLLGLALSSGFRHERWPRFAIEDVHGFVGLLAGAFVVAHGLSLLVDRYVPFSLVQLVVPGLAPYRPLATVPGVPRRRAARRPRRHEPVSTSASGRWRSSTASPWARTAARPG
jgi:hypothetical protein